jgi:hypothetical protein
VPSTLTVSSYEAIFQSCINAGLIPEPSNVNSSKTVSVMMVFLDPSVGINGGGRQLNIPGAVDAGYHDSFTTAAGNPFLNAFSEFTDINFITTIMSHEFAEMITDPLYNAWTPDHASHEIGDYCEGNDTTINVSGRTWTVQEIWSDVANACVASASSKIPPISPGPGGALAADISRLGRGPGRSLDPADVLLHHRVLPLPPVRFDHRNGFKQINDADMMAYARKMFSPLRHDQLFNDFPGFLRQAAAALENRAILTAGSDGGGEHVKGAPGAEAISRKGVAPRAKK